MREQVVINYRIVTLTILFYTDMLLKRDPAHFSMASYPFYLTLTIK